MITSNITNINANTMANKQKTPSTQTDLPFSIFDLWPSMTIQTCQPVPGPKGSSGVVIILPAKPGFAPPSHPVDLGWFYNGDKRGETEKPKTAFFPEKTLVFLKIWYNCQKSFWDASGKMSLFLFMRGRRKLKVIILGILVHRIEALLLELQMG